MIVRKLYVSIPVDVARPCKVKERHVGLRADTIRMFGTMELCDDYVALHQTMMQIDRPH